MKKCANKNNAIEFEKRIELIEKILKLEAFQKASIVSASTDEDRHFLKFLEAAKIKENELRDEVFEIFVKKCNATSDKTISELLWEMEDKL